MEARAPRHKHVQLEGQFCSLVHILCVWKVLQWSWVESAIIFKASDSHISYLYIPRPYLYFILSLHRHMATTSDPMRWRGSSAKHVCWRRSAVRWARGHTGPFRRTPATTPSPSEPSPSLYLRPLGRYSSGARGATAMQASALEASVNELIDTIFGCYPSSKAAGVVPKGVPTIWHKSTARHLAHALKLL